eukprot:15058872-Alexandrium_andersonii.AAC.1
MRECLNAKCLRGHARSRSHACTNALTAFALACACGSRRKQASLLESSSQASRGPANPSLWATRGHECTGVLGMEPAKLDQNNSTSRHIIVLASCQRA